jgi:hypothetical protein
MQSNFIKDELMKALFTFLVFSSVMFSIQAHAENDTYCGRYPNSSVCNNYYVAPANFGPFAFTSSEDMSAPALTAAAPVTVSAVPAAVLATPSVTMPEASIASPSVTEPADEDESEEVSEPTPAVSKPVVYSQPAPVNLPAPEPEKSISYPSPLDSVAAPALTAEGMHYPIVASAAPVVAAPEEKKEVAAPVPEKSEDPASVKSSETIAYCKKYPESPVCIKPLANKTFCEQWPDNPACKSLKTKGAPEAAAKPAASAVLRKPVETNADENSKNADLLLITDQPGAAAAQAIKEKITTMAPFSCMNLKVEVLEVSKKELDCNPEIDPKTPRLLVCNARTRSHANKMRKHLHAKAAIVVVDFDKHAGAGWHRTPLVSSYSLPGAAVHELLHGVGFNDEYPENIETVTGGTIMHALDGNVPQTWWPKISTYFDKPTPLACAGT